MTVQIANHGIIHQGKPVVIYEDSYVHYGGLSTDHGVNTAFIACLSGKPSGLGGPCKNVSDHILHYLQFVERTHPTSYGLRASSAGWQWPFVYLNAAQGGLLRQEIARGAPLQGLEAWLPKSGNRVVAVSTGPVICKKCFFKNDYGANNQQDGTYVCYMCR